MKKLSGMTAEQLGEIYGEEAKNDMQLALSKSPQYNKIQKSMKALLDKFYQSNNLSNNDLIEWEINSPEEVKMCKWAAGCRALNKKEKFQMKDKTQK